VFLTEIQSNKSYGWMTITTNVGVYDHPTLTLNQNNTDVDSPALIINQNTLGPGIEITGGQKVLAVMPLFMAFLQVQPAVAIMLVTLAWSQKRLLPELH
jgi:hypothetical protein